VYAWLPRHPSLVPGDRLAVRGTTKPLPDDASGFRGFLESRGAAGTLKAHRLQLLDSGSGLSGGVEQVRWGLDGWLQRAVPEPEAGLAAGILIGLRERVSREVADDFTITGLTHVVAISGWNIALVAGIVTALLRGAGLARRSRNAVVIVAIVVYTVLAGAEASVVRAAAMGGVVIVARESGRPSSAAAALALATWGLLLAEPAMIDDIGLQLSLAATAGLLVLGGPAEALVRRTTRDRAPRWFCETLGVSLAAQLSTLPLILLHFGRLSLISPLANVLVAPIVPLAMAGAALGVLLGPLMATPLAMLALPAALAGWVPLALMTRGAELLARVPFANLELQPPLDLLGAGLALVALAVALRAARRRRGRSGGTTGAATGLPRSTAAPQPRAAIRRRLPATVVAVVLVSAVSVVLVARPVPSLRVSVLDIGQGDAILLATSDGARMLVDGGPDPDLLVRRLDERIPLWDRQIDLVVVTHPHEDHVGGLAGLVPRYRVSAVAETGIASEGAGMTQLRQLAAPDHIRRVRLVQGDRFELGAARVDVLWPPAELIPDRPLTAGRAINNTSIVLGVTLGRQRVLLTGDLEEDRDPDLLAAIGPDGRRWDLLKVAHHGSATASSGELLEALRPRIAAVSAGVDNRYGHPAASALARLQAVGARVWRTDRHGTLSFALDGRPRTAAALLRDDRRRTACAAPAGPQPPTKTGRRVACYAPPDGGAYPNRSALAAPVHVAFAAAVAAHDRRRGGGLVPGVSQRAGRRRRRSPHGRDGRAPP
jgi:competence protein ComEC